MNEGGFKNWTNDVPPNTKPIFYRLLNLIRKKPSDNKLAVLFDTKAQWVKSAALVPIGTGGHDGMLAIGSSDSTRFYPGMGTLFLDLLADVIASSLAKVQPQEQRRTA